MDGDCKKERTVTSFISKNSDIDFFFVPENLEDFLFNIVKDKEKFTKWVQCMGGYEKCTGINLRDKSKIFAYCQFLGEDISKIIYKKIFNFKDKALNNLKSFLEKE